MNPTPIISGFDEIEINGIIAESPKVSMIDKTTVSTKRIKTASSSLQDN